MSDRHVDPEAVLADLKPFQRRTARWAFERMFNEREPTRRFLVADEVGLGKTHIAKGVIAQVIDHLQQDPQSRQIPVIVLTAKALTVTERVALDQTARTVIQKRGLDRDTLLQELRGLLRAYRDPTPKGLNP